MGSFFFFFGMTILKTGSTCRQFEPALKEYRNSKNKNKNLYADTMITEEEWSLMGIKLQSIAVHK